MAPRDALRPDGTGGIRRVLIANRGEIAVRIARACREASVRAIAIYSDADVHALHVRRADEAVRIGPAAAARSYLNIDAIVAAARATRADAVHPGYGFLSENDAFARACGDAGLIWIGPPADVIRNMGSKIVARRTMEAAGVPVVPGMTPGDQSDAGILAAVHEVGYPVVVKASEGGGGKGMRTLRGDEGAIEMIGAARREALGAFGDGTLYVERLIEQPRHVEFQIFGDSHGNVVHLFERECSLQRRHQKIIEESPSPALTPGVRARMGDAAVAAARAAGYQSAGTIEFLLEGRGDSAQFYFLEMNTRLQVEHPVTEAVAGVDLVHAQLAVAAGAPLPWTQASLRQRGHAIECRVYAEDPDAGFLPQAGAIDAYREPSGEGIRVDAGVERGSVVGVHYDPMLAKLIVSARTREAALARAIEALRAYEIGGIQTNIPFLLRLLEHGAVQRGDVHTQFVESHLDEILAGDAGGEALPADPWLAFTGWGRDRLTGRPAAAQAVRRPRRADAGGRRRAAAHRGPVAAPMPATVVRIHAQPAQAVRRGDTLLILEAMKMELPVRAPADGVVKAIHCREGELVQPGVTLIEFE